MSPPGSATTATNPGCTTGSGERIEKVIRAAHKAIVDCGVVISPRRVNKIVRRFCMNARRDGATTFHEFLSREANLSPVQQRHLAANADLARVLAYADPTGEAAVNHVVRSRGF